MTDLPFGRGGSPLQNLIVRGFTHTKLSALRVEKGLDTGDIYLKEDLEQYGDFYAATEDGSVGIKGNVVDVLRSRELCGDVIYACGPMPMLRALKAYAQEKQIPAYISLEERMACGVGACLGCVCKTTKKDAHSQVHNARICTDGPVFNINQLLWQI